ncbi:MAG TPA: FkbM family methyltransferase [Longimicrobiaceae bacterium]|nr:FkbM family methyltransferase [Longimicrobiaceae bacterium]
MNQQSPRPAPVWVRMVASVVRRLPAGRYRAIQRIGRDAAPPFLMEMPVELGGGTYLCDLRDDIAREVCFTGLYGPQETALVRALLAPGDTFVDVGANWGYFTLLAASLVGQGGRVLSLEPDPRLFPVLEANVARNGLRHVTLRQLAAAGGPGILALAGFDEAAGNFGVSRIVPDAAADGRTFRVRADALDRILDEEGIRRVDLLKMDIEGAEGAALAGLEESLRGGRVARLLVELHPVELAEHGTSTDALVDTLRSAGYTGYTVSHDPAVTRAAAYGRASSLRELLRPLEPGEPLDAWPHQLWCAPGSELRW